MNLVGTKSAALLNKIMSFALFGGSGLFIVFGLQKVDPGIYVINTNRKLVTEFFAKEFPQIQVIDLEATYLLWMDWSGLGLDYKELERINHEEARLFFDEGYVFGAQGEGFERWNLACPTRYIEEALERMKKAYSKYVK